MKNLYLLTVCCLLPFSTFALSGIVGPSSICTGTSITYTDASTGGTWSTSSTNITLGSTGIVTALSAGNANISYSLGVALAVKTITIYTTLPNIGGATFICGTGTTASMTNIATGGTWSSSNTSVATIGSSGIATGVASGFTNIYYITSPGCSTSRSLQIYPSPIQLKGCNNLGVGDTLQFQNPLYSSWSTTSSVIASVNAGTVVGMAPGTATITNSSPYIGCTEGTKTITITASALIKPITGTNIICQGNTLLAPETITGGTWTSSNPAVGTVDATGLITAITGGQTTITYTTGGGSSRCTKDYYINSAPSSITGPSSLCPVETIILNASTTGYRWWRENDIYYPYTECYPGDYYYAWGWGPLPVIYDCGSYTPPNSFTSGSTATATAYTIGGIGYITGVSPGSAVITFRDGVTYCTTNTTVTVDPFSLPPITGTLDICISSTSTLSIAATGGTWSSSNPAISSVGATSGIVTGISTGTATITYSHSGACGQRIVVVSINPSPAAITGNSGNMCIGSTQVLSNVYPGGTWSSSSTSIASVDASSGLVTALSAGSVIITYTAGPCANFTTTSINVNTSFPITGVMTVCPGLTTLLSTVAGPGTWSSGNVSVATAGVSGLISAVSAGTAIITFTSAYCTPVTAIVSVHLTSPITGPSVICIGLPSTMSNTVAGGTWGSSNTSVANINISTGVVSSTTAGSGTITYTTPSGCLSFIGVTSAVRPTPFALSGGGNYCIGDAGVYINQNGSSSLCTYQLYRGALVVGSPLTGTGLAFSFGLQTAGAYTVLATNIATGCTRPMNGTITSTALTSPNPITGQMLICVGGTGATLSDATYGGTWSSGNPSVATIDMYSGLLGGSSAGTATISYNTSCGTATATVTVSPIPPAITGTTTFCQASYTYLGNPIPGGTWSSGSTSVASIGGGVGGVYGVSGGTATISYNTGTCGITTAVVSVSPIAPITGYYFPICGTSSTTLADATPGGTWSSSNTAVATVGSLTGIVTGNGSNTMINANISYTLPSGCSRNVMIYAYPNPTSLPLCNNLGIGDTLHFGFFSAGMWNSSNAAVASMTSVGDVRGIATGSVTISLISAVGCVQYVNTLTVTPTALIKPINGYNLVCPGETSTLTSGVAGGIWSSASPSVATVSSSGTVTGISPGGSMITYSNGSGTAVCLRQFYVNPVPLPITGPSVLCTGDTILLASSTPASSGYGPSHSNYPQSAICYNGNYAWGAPIPIDCLSFPPGNYYTSSDTNVARMLYPNLYGYSGYTRGVSTGTAIITVTSAYTHCSTTRPVTVNALPVVSISGTLSVCAGSTTALSSITSGGIWSSSNTGVAMVGSTGIVTGVTSGTSIISYAASNSCGTSVATVTVTVDVYPVAGTISGTLALCVGTSSALSSSGPGGVWTTSNATIASIGSTGVVTGVSGGVATITYTRANACGVDAALATVTVSTLPSAGTVTGPSVVCAGATITLTSSATGGIWTSGSAAATVSSTGLVTGISAGTATISYTLSNICGTAVATKYITVNPLSYAGSITGASSVCVGSYITLSVTGTGGVWTASGTAGTITSSGVLTGVTAGSTTVSYSVTNSCGSDLTTTLITINPLPLAGTISGTGTVCVGSSTTLSSSSTGGSWASGSAAATVTTTGVVTGVLAGTATISYSVTTSCGTNVATTIISVNPLPVAGSISGPSVVCEGASITLSVTVTGGVWTASGTAGTITSTGVLTGITTGSTTVSYSVTNGCGTDVSTALITVNPLPIAGMISGTSTVCEGSSTTLSSSATGGSWASGSAAATVTTTGVVTGVLAGTATISYSVTNSCGTDVATMTATITPLPSAGSISGPSVVCEGSSITLSITGAGGAWTASSAAGTITTTGVLTGVTAGSTTVSYSVTNSCGTDVSTALITVNPLPLAGTISGTSAVCESSSITLSSSATGGVWSSSNTTIATAGSSGTVTGISAGTAIISYTASNTCGTAVAIIYVTVNPLPYAGSISGASAVCVGSSVSLAASVTSGSWSAGSSAVSVSTSGAVTGIAAGAATISYSVTNGCGTGYAVHALTVDPAVTPSVTISTSAPATLCSGTSVLFTTTPVNEGTAPVYEWRVNGAISGTGASTYTYVPADGDTVKVKLTSNAACVLPDSASGIITMSVTATETPMADITPYPSDTICAGTSAAFTVSATWDGPSPVFVWYKNSAMVGSGTTYSCTPTTGDVIYCRLASSYVCRSIDTANSDSVTMTLSTVYMPVVSITASAGLFIAAGQPDTLTAYVTGAGPSPSYQWFVNSVMMSGSTNTMYTSSSFADNDSVTCVVADTDACSFVTFNSVIIHVASSVRNDVKASSISIFPNPTNGEIFVKGYLNHHGNSTDMVITNMLGQIVYRGTATVKNWIVDERLKLDNTLANGVYLLQVHTINGHINVHFSLQR